MKIAPVTDKAQYMIFASDLGHAETVKLLDANLIPFKAVNGCYKGIKERAYVTLAGYGVRALGILDKQESVLLLGKRQGDIRKARLQYSDGRVVEIGDFTESTKDAALKQDGYTEDNGNYYIVKGE